MKKDGKELLGICILINWKHTGPSSSLIISQIKLFIIRFYPHFTIKWQLFCLFYADDMDFQQTVAMCWCLIRIWPLRIHKLFVGILACSSNFFHFVFAHSFYLPTSTASDSDSATASDTALLLLMLLFICQREYILYFQIIWGISEWVQTIKIFVPDFCSFTHSLKWWFINVIIEWAQLNIKNEHTNTETHRKGAPNKFDRNKVCYSFALFSFSFYFCSWVDGGTTGNNYH